MSAAATKGTGSRILDDLAEVIGEAAALALAWEFRGLNLYIPQDPGREPGIAKAIGEDLAVRLCDVFWRTSIYMPLREVTRARVHQLAGNTNMTKQEIAIELGIAERQVYRLLESAARSAALDCAVDDRQMKLL